MKYPHIATGPHMEDRFRINTAPGIMEPKYGVNEAHGSFLQRAQVEELHAELTVWMLEHPTVEERVREIVATESGDRAVERLIDLVETERAAG